MRVIAFAAVVLLVGCKDRKAEKPAPEAPKTAVVDAAAAAKDDVKQRWGGKIETPPDVPLEFELRIECTDTPRAALAIPSQNLAPTELVDVTCKGGAMTFTLAIPGMAESAHARFDVKTAPDGTAGGVMRQHGKELRVTMRRLADGETIGGDAPPRPQMPKPPFPYAERMITYASGDGTTLAGTLTVPEGAGKHPAVLLVTGTGAQDRDETLFGHKPFWVLADHLSRNGVAVLRLDDRGVGGSGGSTDDSDLETKVDDALAGVAWLAAQPEIEPTRIGILGHSEGGTIAPLAAAASPSVAFIVMLAGPGVTGAEIGVHQMEILMKAEGATAEMIAARVAGQKKLIAAALDGTDYSELKAAVDEHIAELEDLGQVTLDAATRDALVKQSLAQLTGKAARSFLATDPRPAMQKVRVPTLALWGSLDLQVDPAQNEPEVKAAFAKDAPLTTKVFPGLNHLFQPAKKGTIEEYATIETTIDPTVLHEITIWLRGVAAPAPPQ